MSGWVVVPPATLGDLPEVWTGDPEAIESRVAALASTGADARLIAAAPDLLEACEAMVDAARSGAKVDVGSPYYDLAIQAIAKATEDL